MQNGILVLSQKFVDGIILKNTYMSSHAGLRGDTHHTKTRRENILPTHFFLKITTDLIQRYAIIIEYVCSQVVFTEIFAFSAGPCRGFFNVNGGGGAEK